MNVSYREVDTFRVATITGQVTEEESYEFRKKAMRLIDDGCKDIILNLQDISHVTSYTIGLFVSLWKRIATTGGSFGVIINNTHLREKLFLVHLNTIIRFFESEQEFLNELSKAKKRSIEFTVRDAHSFKIVDLHESFNVFCGFHQFDELVTDLYEQGSRRIALNLSGVEHVYSEAIGVVVRWTKILAQKSGMLALVGLTPEVRSRLEILEIEKALNIFESERELKSCS